MASVRPNAVTNSRSEAVRAESYRTSRRRVRRCRVPFGVDTAPAHGAGPSISVAVTTLARRVNHMTPTRSTIPVQSLFRTP